MTCGPVNRKCPPGGVLQQDSLAAIVSNPDWVPGEWRVGTTSNPMVHRIRAEGSLNAVATVTAPSAEDWTMMQATAFLLAAAPRLFSTLVEVRAHLEELASRAEPGAEQGGFDAEIYTKVNVALMLARPRVLTGSGRPESGRHSKKK